MFVLWCARYFQALFEDIPRAKHLEHLPFPPSICGFFNFDVVTLDAEKGGREAVIEIGMSLKPWTGIRRVFIAKNE